MRRRTPEAIFAFLFSASIIGQPGVGQIKPTEGPPNIPNQGEFIAPPRRDDTKRICNTVNMPLLGEYNRDKIVFEKRTMCTGVPIFDRNSPPTEL